MGRVWRNLRTWWQRLYTPAHRTQAQPLNKFSLGIIIVIDIFILWQVFSGLGAISAWPLSPNQAYPCYSPWQAYLDPLDPADNQTQASRDFQEIRTVLESFEWEKSLVETYQTQAQDHLGQLSPVCIQFATARDALNTPANQNTLNRIKEQDRAIEALVAANAKIRQEYDSTLLEQIAGQDREQSINSVGATEARASLQANEAKITALKTANQQLQNTLTQRGPGQAFFAFLNQEPLFQEVERGYNQARFWHPTQQLILQVLFLTPLIVLAAMVHRWATSRQFGLVGLMSWHLLVIFLIPLVIKIFEVLQFGVVLDLVVQVITALLGQLLFLVSYFYILLVPAVGFFLIKIGQRLFFHPPTQASHRLQKSRCLQCGKKIQATDHHCPHCGFDQFQECPSCHHPTYRYAPYCKACGADLSQLPEGTPSS